MGFDCYGVKPNGSEPPKVDWDIKESRESYFKWQDSTKGGYFRNNCWWWRPLWNFVCEVCADIITDEEKEKGHYNDGYLIDADRALQISARLVHLVDQGEVKKYEDKYTTMQQNLPLIDCWLCEGTGKRLDGMVVPHGCNACHGSGKRKDPTCEYPFSTENVEEFAIFCRHSGGFTIC